MPPTKAKSPPAAEQAVIEQATTEAAAANQVTKSGEAPVGAAPIEPAVTHASQFTHRITAVPEKGFCRAGRSWYHEATSVNRDDFSDEQWEALEAEPMLVVVIL